MIVTRVGSGLPLGGGHGVFWSRGAAGAALAVEAVGAVVGIEVGRIYASYVAARVSPAGTGRRGGGGGGVESDGGSS